MPAHRTGSASQRGTSVAEVNLRRLLAKCDATLVGGGGNPGRDPPLTAPPLPPELASAAASSASALSADGSREPAGGTLDGVPPRAAPPLPHANAVAAPGSDDPFPPGQVSAGASSPPSPHQPDAAVLRRRAALDRNKFATVRGRPISQALICRVRGRAPGRRVDGSVRVATYLSKLLADVEAEDQALGASLLLQFNGLARLGKNAPAGVGVVDALADTSRSRGWFNTPTSMAIVRAAERAALVEYRRKIAVLFDLMNELKLVSGE
ncbi:MAG: hypothetical protein BJ554DRAFT_8323 [Olpidium bornovanus]|uniref:Uncharacterized protein n=1 Tax=Olpidium bornovanus TaxID=278681 RepID=A0A8H7ZV42_9FUNG|nr:MAG: hypothetical protein BJ554DRAFT_8323 [Olpidium bornovanus]